MDNQVFKPGKGWHLRDKLQRAGDEIISRIDWFIYLKSGKGTEGLQTKKPLLFFIEKLGEAH